LIGCFNLNDGEDECSAMFGLVLRAEENSVLIVTLEFEVLGKRKRGCPKSTWTGKVKKHLKKAYSKEDVRGVFGQMEEDK